MLLWAEKQLCWELRTQGRLLGLLPSTQNLTPAGFIHLILPSGTCVSSGAVRKVNQTQARSIPRVPVLPEA